MTENVYDYDAKQRAQDIVNQIDQGKLPENPNYEHQGTDAIGNVVQAQQNRPEEQVDPAGRSKPIPAWDDNGYRGDDTDVAPPRPQRAPLGQLIGTGLAGYVGRKIGRAVAGAPGEIVGGIALPILLNDIEADTVVVRDEIPDIR